MKLLIIFHNLNLICVLVPNLGGEDMLKLVSSQCMEPLGAGQWRCTVCGMVRGKKDLR